MLNLTIRLRGVKTITNLFGTLDSLKPQTLSLALNVSWWWCGSVGARRLRHKIHYPPPLALVVARWSICAACRLLTLAFERFGVTRTSRIAPSTGRFLWFCAHGTHEERRNALPNPQVSLYPYP